MSRRIDDLLARHAIVREGVRVPDVPADWTLLISSGGHGDKLAVGFRGCHAALAADALEPWLDRGCDLRVVAGLPNRLAARVLQAPGACCRLFAPSLRNVRDRGFPVSGFAGAIDVLCCNRLEWETLADREEVGWRVSILVVTEGPAGAWARFTGPQGETGTIRMPAFPERGLLATPTGRARRSPRRWFPICSRRAGSPVRAWWSRAWCGRRCSMPRPPRPWCWTVWISAFQMALSW